MKPLAGKEGGFRNEFNSQNAGPLLDGGPKFGSTVSSSAKGEYELNGLYGVHMEKAPTAQKNPTNQRESSPKYLQR